MASQTISYDTISAAFPVFKMISIVLECVSVYVWVNLTARDSDAASASISLFASPSKSSNGLCHARVFSYVCVAQCLIVCVIMHLKAAGALQEQPLFEVPKDNQAGNPHILSLGLVYRQLEKCVKHVSADSCRL